MGRFAVQYLEDGPGVAAIAPQEVRARLRAAFERLPISRVLLGWNLPRALVEACRAETTGAGAQLFRWHPLLTGDGSFVPRLEWRTAGLSGEPVPGFRGLDEFTFVCPNRPAVRDAVLEHLREAIRHGDYEGVFLDRIRYPSPAADPGRLLACFCDDCQRVALSEGVDLADARRRIQALLGTPEGVRAFVRALLDPLSPPSADPNLAALRMYLRFRAHSVTRLVQAAADVVHAEGLAVGLDCFSPALTTMVGQDLGALDPHCEWIKIMSYGHALGPSGLPFEILDLAGWLIGHGVADGGGMPGESGALQVLSLASGLPLPSSRDALRDRGLVSAALATEVQRARAAGVRVLLAGIELVEIAGLTHLHDAQIEADLRAFRAAGAGGLVLSWDLWHIPLQRLEMIRRIWGG